MLVLSLDKGSPLAEMNLFHRQEYITYLLKIHKHLEAVEELMGRLGGAFPRKKA